MKYYVYDEYKNHKYLGEFDTYEEAYECAKQYMADADEECDVIIENSAKLIFGFFN